MQKLHLVGFTTDHKGLILSARRGARSGGFVLAVDDAVAEAVASAMARADEVAEPDEEVVFEELAPPRPQSALSVKELQARLRSGRTIESVAAEAGVDVDWVTRFAAPVIAEQGRVIDDTRNATFSRPRLGPSALRLGPSVYRNLAAKGLTTPVDELDKGWSTRQVADGRWLVTFRYVSRGRKQKAAWELDLRRGEVRAVDRLAAELAFVPGAPKPATPAAAPTKPVKVPASGATDLDRANARRVAEARKAAEAQLADAARRSTKRSAEVAKRASSPKALAERAKRAAVEASLPVEEPPALVTVDDLTERAEPVEVAAADPVEAPPVEAVQAADDVEDAAPADDPPEAEGVDDPVVGPEIDLEDDDAPTPARPPAAHRDPAASAVAMVREAAEAMLSDFAAGRLADVDLLDDRSVPTWDDAAAAEATDDEPLEVDDVPAARPVPTRRRRPPVAARPPQVEEASSTTADPPPAASAPADRRSPSRALTRAVAPPIEVADDRGRPRQRRDEQRGDDRVRGLVFRDDLAALAHGNGADAPVPPAPAAPAAAPGPATPAPRRRRSQPLRAR